MVVGEPEEEVNVAAAADGGPESRSFVEPPESLVAPNAKGSSVLPIVVLVILVLIGSAGLYLGMRGSG